MRRVKEGLVGKGKSQGHFDSVRQAVKQKSQRNPKASVRGYMGSQAAVTASRGAPKEPQALWQRSHPV